MNGCHPKNSSPTSAIITCNKIGKCVILVGPIKARFSGKELDQIQTLTKTVVKQGE